MCPPAQAYWIEDGVGLCTEASSQSEPRIVSDGMGGTIIAWLDYRNGNSDLYAQRISVSGMPLWTADGVPVCIDAANLSFSYVNICADGSGGAIITWMDYRNADTDIYAQRIGPDGTARWTTNGVGICTSAFNQQYPQAVTDGQGGAIIVWEDWRNGNLDVFAQRVDAGGVLWWALNGAYVCTAANNQTWVRAASDGAGGIIAAWMDSRNGNADIYAQRVNITGATVWTPNGVAICTLTQVQGNPHIVADGSGGAFIGWQDQRSDMSDIYVQRIDGGGSVQWTGDGVAVCTAFNGQYYAYLDQDGSGGLLVSWIDDRTGVYQISVQRLNGSGTALWTGNGVELTARPTYQYDPRVVSDGTGGAIVSWHNYNNIYAQRVDSGGSVQWIDNGLLVCGAANIQNACLIIPNGAGGACITWEDNRANTNDIYVSNVENDGELYEPLPLISSVGDIPADQGGMVWLAWDASRDEIFQGNLVTGYTIWRAIDPVAALLMRDEGQPFLAAADGIPADLPEYMVREELLGEAAYYWQLVAAQDIYYQNTYGLPLETLYDSTGAGTAYHYFQVVAQTVYSTMYFASAPDSGYSVDNLAPCPPLALEGEQSYSPEGLTLTWAPNDEADLDCYNIYRDVDPTFDPAPGNLLASTCDTMTFDGGWSWDSGFCYKVAAVDVHGNESEYAILCREQVTGDDPMPLPDATFLAQNFPNPFNPITTIGFGMKEPGYISLRIYDAAGRLVATLVDESRPAGSYAADWNGRGTDGHVVSSGVYFYRLSGPGYERTRKMVLLK
jgi:hypothetical protein